MEKHTFYFSPLCPDCLPFQQELDAQGIVYEAVNITESMANLKKFLYIRDNQPVFEAAKNWGQVGIPLLVTKDNQFIFDVNDLMGTTCNPPEFAK